MRPAWRLLTTVVISLLLSPTTAFLSAREIQHKGSEEHTATRTVLSEPRQQEGSQPLSQDGGPQLADLKFNQFVQTMLSRDFEEPAGVVHTSGRPWVINLYVGWCPHCRRFAEEWGALAKELAGLPESWEVPGYKELGVNRGSGLW